MDQPDGDGQLEIEVPWAERCVHVQRSPYRKFIASLEQHRLPETAPYFEDTFACIDECPYSRHDARPTICLECPARDYYSLWIWVRKFGMFALVTLQHTRQLACLLQGKHVLEVMAGSGWLAHALTKYGVDVDATDDGSWGLHKKVDWGIRICEAEEAALESDADVLLMCWPPYDSDVASKTARAWGGERPIVYIGEGESGCCANDEFFSLVWLDHCGIYWPQWYGLHDNVAIGGLYGGTCLNTVDMMLEAAGLEREGRL